MCISGVGASVVRGVAALVGLAAAVLCNWCVGWLQFLALGKDYSPEKRPCSVLVDIFLGSEKFMLSSTVVQMCPGASCTPQGLVWFWQ